MMFMEMLLGFHFFIFLNNSAFVVEMKSNSIILLAFSCLTLGFDVPGNCFLYQDLVVAFFLFVFVFVAGDPESKPRIG